MLSGAVRCAVKGRLPWVRARDWKARREVRFMEIWSGVGGGEWGGKIVGVDIVGVFRMRGDAEFLCIDENSNGVDGCPMV